VAGQEENVPTFRLRVNDSSLQFAMLLVINSQGVRDVPMAGQPVEYVMWLQAPPEVNGNNWLFSFDYLYDSKSNDDPTISLSLRSLTVEEIVLLAR
jgi:hypothetical protein